MSDFCSIFRFLPKFLFELFGRTECLSAQRAFDALLAGGHLMIEPYLHAFNMNIIAAPVSNGRQTAMFSRSDERRHGHLTGKR